MPANHTERLWGNVTRNIQGIPEMYTQDSLYNQVDSLRTGHKYSTLQLFTSKVMCGLQDMVLLKLAGLKFDATLEVYFVPRLC